jgi:hypothetical protein
MLNTTWKTSVRNLMMHKSHKLNNIPGLALNPTLSLQIIIHLSNAYGTNLRQRGYAKAGVLAFFCYTYGHMARLDV